MLNALRALCPQCECGSVLGLNINCSRCLVAISRAGQSVIQTDYLSPALKGLVFGVGASVIVAGQLYQSTTYETVQRERASRSFEEIRTPLNTECSICLDAFQPRDNVIHTRCQHTFHTVCLRNWRQSTCPNCRAEVPPD